MAFNYISVGLLNKSKHLFLRVLYIKYGVKSPQFIWAPWHSRTHWLRPRNPGPPPRIWAHIRGRC
jgi:hypothetical protein